VVTSTIRLRFDYSTTFCKELTHQFIAKVMQRIAAMTLALEIALLKLRRQHIATSVAPVYVRLWYTINYLSWFTVYLHFVLRGR